MRNSIFMAAPPRPSLCSRICMYVCDWGGGGTLLLSLPFMDFLQPQPSKNEICQCSPTSEFTRNISAISVSWKYGSCHQLVSTLKQLSYNIKLCRKRGTAVFTSYPTEIFITWWELGVRKQVPPGWYYLFNLSHQRHGAIENGIC